MASVRGLIRKNVERARHWLPFLSEETRERILLIPSLFSLGKGGAGIFSHPTCTPEQFALLKKHLKAPPDIAVSRIPDYVLIESLIALPGPSVVGTDFLAVDLMVVPEPGADREIIRAKCAEVEVFSRARGGILRTHIIEGGLPPLVLMRTLNLGVVLAGRHPVTRPQDVADMGFFAGEVPEVIRDNSTLDAAEWNPFRHALDEELSRSIAAEGYRPPRQQGRLNPFLAPYLARLIRHEETLDVDTLLYLRLCMAALFSHFGPTREAMADMMRSWGLTFPQVPDISVMDLREALGIRKCYVPLDEHELPVYSWPASRTWRKERVVLDWDGAGWSLGESDLFRHRHAWVTLAWGAIAGLIGPDTDLKSPEGLQLKPDAPVILARMLCEIAQGTHIVVPADARQGSIRIRAGRFFFSETPYAVMESGPKASLNLFHERKKKALLDDSGL